MSIDSKSASLFSSDGITTESPSESKVGARRVALFTRFTLFLSILTFSVLCSYGYVSAFGSGTYSMPSGWIGLLVVALAMTEMTMADYADRLPFHYASKAATIPYGFFVLAGFATAASLLYHQEQIAAFSSLHLMAFFAVITTVLGATVMWHCLAEAGEKLIDTLENLW